MESVTTFATDGWRWCRSYVPSLVWNESYKPVPSAVAEKAVMTAAPVRPLGGGGTPLVGSPFLRFAGLSGALAVAMGAYGAHAFAADKPEMKKVYDTANFYHFMHTLALLAVPLSRRPALTGSLMITGTAIFCGTIYYNALTEERKFRKYTPYGGIILMMAWLSMAL